MVNWLTAFIALIVALISALQWITARQKVVLDLFDKRFALYDELRKVIERYGGDGPKTNDIEKFAQAVSRAQFLFGAEVTEYLKDRMQDLIREFVLRKRGQSTSEERHQGTEKEYVTLVNRLTNFFKDFDILVAPYMKHTQKRLKIPYIHP